MSKKTNNFINNILCETKIKKIKKTMKTLEIQIYSIKCK